MVWPLWRWPTARTNGVVTGTRRNGPGSGPRWPALRRCHDDTAATQLYQDDTSGCPHVDPVPMHSPSAAQAVGADTWRNEPQPKRRRLSLRSPGAVTPDGYTHWERQFKLRLVRRMLDEAVRSGRVEILQRGGHGGRELPSSGDRRGITVKTVQGDSMVRRCRQTMPIILCMCKVGVHGHEHVTCMCT